MFPHQNKPKSPLAWQGGKSLLTEKIIPLIPEHTTYVELFAGAAWLFFRKEPSKVEVINDINSDLVTLYRVVQNHLEEFVKCLKWLVVARDEYARFMDQRPETLTDIQRAVRFYYLMKAGFGAKITGQSFGVSVTQPSRFNLMRIEEELSQAHIRLHRAYIENQPYPQVIKRYDRPGTFFYVDPPYWGCEGQYGKGLFARADFESLRDQLSGIKGRFVMSINDVPDIRELYKCFYIKPVPTRYSIGKDRSPMIQELLITNFRP